MTDNPSRTARTARPLIRAPLVALLCVALFSGACADDDGCTLSGTLTYLGTGSLDLSNKTYDLWLDNDTDENTAPVHMFSGTWAGGTTQRYSVDVTQFAPGTYYLYARILEPATFLVYGWYNTDPAQPFNPRVLADVQCGSVYDFDVDQT
jgi:hypothetical protein